MSGIIDLPTWNLPIWAYVLIALAMTHITIASVTLYLHRCMSHRALQLHPVVSHFFRFWLWITTGMNTKEWVAIHRKHHACVESEDDPHSPVTHGIKKVLLEGAELYRKEAKNAETLERYGHGCPEDWVERNVYTPQSYLGYVLMLVINVLAFGPIGITIFAVQMLWIPVTAAGIINGWGHYRGYRNFETQDASTNIVPWGVIIGGEELHNNHHAFASSARFSSRRFEFDIGWQYIRVLQALGLARVKKESPKPVMVPEKSIIDADTVSTVITARFQVMANYAKTVVARVHAEEIGRVDETARRLLKSARALIVCEDTRLTREARERLHQALEHSHALETVYRLKHQLQEIWQERGASRERLLESLQQWCRDAEESGIRALQEFARTLPNYTLKPI
ncbi:MAG: DesA family fatty acid desaturase [Gammaproteobacteria bacterium]